MLIELKDYDVEINDKSLNWGQKEIIRMTLFDLDEGKMTAESYLKAKIKRLEYAVLAIKEKEGGSVIPFSADFVFDLSPEDGEKLIDEVNKLDEKKNTESKSQKS